MIPSADGIRKYRYSHNGKQVDIVAVDDPTGNTDLLAVALIDGKNVSLEQLFYELDMPRVVRIFNPLGDAIMSVPEQIEQTPVHAVEQVTKAFIDEKLRMALLRMENENCIRAFRIMPQAYADDGTTCSIGGRAVGTLKKIGVWGLIKNTIINSWKTLWGALFRGIQLHAITQKDSVTTSLDEEKIQDLSKQLASKIHDSWRSKRNKVGLGYEPKVENTTDAQWIRVHKSNVVDIANTPFEKLPADWQSENYLSANVAIRSIAEALRVGMPLDESFIEDTSERIHDGWVQRQLANPKSQSTEEQLSRYTALPESEKEQDRIIVQQAIALYEAVDRKQILSVYDVIIPEFTQQERNMYKQSGEQFKAFVVSLPDGRVYQEKSVHFRFTTRDEVKTQLQLMVLLTKQGFFHPKTTWFYYQLNDGGYSIGSFMPLLSKTRTIAKPSIETTFPLLEPLQRVFPTIDLSVVKTDPRFQQQKVWFSLLDMDAFHPDNWADDGNRIYLVDIEGITAQPGEVEVLIREIENIHIVSE